MSAGGKEAEHCFWWPFFWANLFLFRWKEIEKSIEDTHYSLAFVIVKHMFNLRVALLRIKSRRKGQQDGKWDRSKKTRLCKVVFKKALVPKPLQRGTHPAPNPPSLHPVTPCPHTPACIALAWENTCTVFSQLDFKCYAAEPWGEIGGMRTGDRAHLVPPQCFAP